MFDARMACRWCGGGLVFDWEMVQYLNGRSGIELGSVKCRNPDCQPTCPVCRRIAGDIHSALCGGIIAEKLGDLAPCTITEADCGPRYLKEGRNDERVDVLRRVQDGAQPVDQRHRRGLRTHPASW